MTTPDLTAATQRYLAAYVRRRRRAAAVRAAGWAVATFAATGLIACAADRLHPLPAAGRAALLSITIAAPVAVAARSCLRMARRRFDPVAAAAAVEWDHPRFAHRLVTAASAGGSADLRAALAADVADAIAAVGPARVSRRPAAVAWGVVLAVGVVAAGLWRWPWLDLPHLAERLARPTAPLAAVTAVRLAVRPGPDRVAENGSFAVVATAAPLTPADAVTLHLSDDGQTWAERPMRPTGDGGYAATVSVVDADVRYFVTAGDAVSPTATVRVPRVPAVVAFRVRGEPSGVATTTTDGRLDVPAGSAVTVDVVATVPLRAATLVVGQERVGTAGTADPCVRRARFVPAADGPVTVELVGVDGTVGHGPPSARVWLVDSGAGQPRSDEPRRRRPRSTTTAAVAHPGD